MWYLLNRWYLKTPFSAVCTTQNHRCYSYSRANCSLFNANRRLGSCNPYVTDDLTLLLTDGYCLHFLHGVDRPEMYVFICNVVGFVLRFEFPILCMNSIRHLYIFNRIWWHGWRSDWAIVSNATCRGFDPWTEQICVWATGICDFLCL